MSTVPTVGWIGLGLMGQPMALNVLRAGFPLVVHNRSRGAVATLVAAGAAEAWSPREVASRAEIVVTCLPGPAEVTEVYLGADGVLTATRPGMLLIDTSTIDPETHRRIARAAAEHGADYLDAPVSGGTTGAREGTLTVMVGGRAEAVERARPILQAFGRTIYHLGPVGSGAIAKLINNLMAAINLLGVCEGLVLAAKAGLDLDLFCRVIADSSGASRSFSGAAPAILARDFRPGFMIDLMHKDVTLALDLARQVGVRTLAGALAQQVLQEARNAGLGRQSTAAQIIPLEQNAGVTVQRPVSPPSAEEGRADPAPGERSSG